MNRYRLRTFAIVVSMVLMGFTPAAVAQLTTEQGKPAPGSKRNLQTKRFQIIQIHRNVAVRAVETPGAILKSAEPRPISLPLEAWATAKVQLPLYDDIALQPPPTVALKISIGSDGKPEEIRVVDPHHTDVTLARLARQLVKSWEFAYVRRSLQIGAPPQLAEQIRRAHEQAAAHSTITVVLHFSVEPLPLSARTI